MFDLFVLRCGKTVYFEVLGHPASRIPQPTSCIMWNILVGYFNFTLPATRILQNVGCGFRIKESISKTSCIPHSAFVGCGLWEEKNQNIQLKYPAFHNLWVVGCRLGDGQKLQNKQSLCILKQTNQA